MGSVFGGRGFGSSFCKPLFFDIVFISAPLFFQIVVGGLHVYTRGWRHGDVFSYVGRKLYYKHHSGPLISIKSLNLSQELEVCDFFWWFLSSYNILVSYTVLYLSISVTL